MILGGQFELEIRGQFKLERGGQFRLEEGGQLAADFPFCNCLAERAGKVCRRNILSGEGI